MIPLDYFEREQDAANRVSTERLSFAPLQLAAEYFEKCFLESQQLRGIFRPNAAHNISISHRHANLSIETQVGFLLSGLHLDLNLHRIAHNDGPMR